MIKTVLFDNYKKVVDTDGTLLHTPTAFTTVYDFLNKEEAVAKAKELYVESKATHYHKFELLDRYDSEGRADIIIEFPDGKLIERVIYVLG